MFEWFRLRFKLLFKAILCFMARRPFFIKMWFAIQAQVSSAASFQPDSTPATSSSSTKKTASPELVKTISAFAEWDDFVEEADRLACGPFSLADDFQGPFDYIAFDAAFHHCETPVEILSLLRRKTASDGMLVFFNEPITDYFDRPWGFIRSDGETAFQIRKHAWFEVGIRTDFFKELLEKTGWKLLDISSHKLARQTFIAKPI